MKVDATCTWTWSFLILNQILLWHADTYTYLNILKQTHTNKFDQSISYRVIHSHHKPLVLPMYLRKGLYREGYLALIRNAHDLTSLQLSSMVYPWHLANSLVVGHYDQDAIIALSRSFRGPIATEMEFQRPHPHPTAPLLFSHSFSFLEMLIPR